MIEIGTRLFYCDTINFFHLPVVIEEMRIPFSEKKLFIELMDVGMPPFGGWIPGFVIIHTKKVSIMQAVPQ